MTNAQKQYLVRNHRSAWTPEQDQLVTKLFNQGIYASHIAQRVGRTSVAVTSRLKTLGLLEYKNGVLYTMPRPYYNVFSKRQILNTGRSY